MIQIQVKLTPDRCKTQSETLAALRRKCAQTLRIPPSEILHIEMIRKSLDARKKPQLHFIFSVALSLPKEMEKRLLHAKHRANGQITKYEELPYCFPQSGTEQLAHRPVIIGTGPAGLFCGYYLALHGYKPLLIERGACVEERTADVARFWNGGGLDTQSNVQFGEGGAGTFSDGKLNTLVKDASGRNKEVLRCFVKNGADQKILYENKPHLGTDTLAQIVRRMRETICASGGEVRFHARATDLQIENQTIRGVVVNESEMIAADAVVLAVGHSARDTLGMLYARRLPLERKAFAVGVRVEHPQSLINDDQYGADCPYEMAAADYKVTAKSSDGRGVYSFCMCPGGYVVNASSEEGHLAVNGMSYAARDGKNANSAMIVTVSPEDYDAFLSEMGEDVSDVPLPLRGAAFAGALEKRAYAAGAGCIPVQRFADFKANQASTALGGILPQTKGAYRPADVRSIFPLAIGDALAEGITSCGRRLPGFDGDDVPVEGVESRTSSPVRIVRNTHYESDVRGIFPCGEGAGYAGGITSAAMDGLKIAEEIAKRYKPL